MACLAAAAAGLPSAARAQQIVAAWYNGRLDTIDAVIDYRGTNPYHHFRLVWGACAEQRHEYAVSARIIDNQWRDDALDEYRVRTHMRLDGLRCRPALVTVRIGRASHREVQVPAEPLSNR